ncbi:hypothetical protein CK501_02010 [Halovibrio salipaludis]|uniref:Uncharacterized protein n=1 Tax=Halovibrio salipaludis TaxID=2032626 RepID=A0A2A2FB91_9GAMM|nr:hypothetical protein [Halovibrio salipaludis]PAU81947.1 hypothetical protein CK501_02010 [Halovibrio salipaludis]
MKTDSVLSRYNTADFDTKPVVALANLMGLSKPCIDEIKASPSKYAPHLTGVVLYRHLPEQKQRLVLRRMLDQLPWDSRVLRDLRKLIGFQRVQPYWFMWSLNDAELKEFFTFNRQVRTWTNHTKIPEITTEVTVAGVASTILSLLSKGFRGTATETIRALYKSPLVKAVAERFGKDPEKVVRVSGVTVFIFILIAGINIAARKSSDEARKELAARGLLVYEDL